MFIKSTIIKSLSLCVLAFCTATPITISQTSNTPATQAATEQNVMPIARTLTAADGRTIDVTILSKSETAIKAKRADGKVFEIALDKLSVADRAFVAGLTDGPGKAAPGKKASVLYVVQCRSDDYEPKHKEQIDWLRNNGYDVTIGVDHYFKTTMPRFGNEKMNWLTPIAMMDAYDIVWIQEFDYSNTEASTDPTRGKEYNFYHLANHRNNQGGITVIRTWKDDKKPFLVYKPTPLTRGPRKGRNEGNFVKTDGAWVFFWDKEDGAKNSKETIRLNLLKEIEELLSKKKR